MRIEKTVNKKELLNFDQAIIDLTKDKYGLLYIIDDLERQCEELENNKISVDYKIVERSKDGERAYEEFILKYESLKQKNHELEKTVEVFKKESKKLRKLNKELCELINKINQ